VTRRVVVTGVGLLSPVGIGTAENWNGLVAGHSGIATITRFDPAQFAARIAGEVKGFDPLKYFEKKDVKKMDVFIQYALVASQFAMEDAGLTVTPDIAEDVGVFIASGIGGFSTIEREHIELLNGGPRRISPFFIPASIINLAAGRSPSGSARRVRTWRRVPRVPRRRTRSARPPKSSSAATPTS
jgi:3-oxoacyl-[acyl-carrier-protein] synthase II